jgi:hypothetical protein
MKLYEIVRNCQLDGIDAERGNEIRCVIHIRKGGIIFYFYV